MSLHKKGREKEDKTSHHSHFSSGGSGFKISNSTMFYVVGGGTGTSPEQWIRILMHPDSYFLMDTENSSYRIHYAVPGIFKLDPDPH